MLLFLKILILLWLINFTPPLLTHFMEDLWDTPLDKGRCLKDGKPILGPHKCQRGFLGGILAGWLVGLLFGLPWWLGLLTGWLSMLGDCSSSFIKRRLGWESGTVVPGLDQALECLFPFLILGPYYSMNGWEILLLVVIFSAGAFVGSWFFKKILLMKPFESYHRPVRTSTRLRELRRCQVTSKPLHYLLNFEDAIYYHFLMKTVFRLLGLYEKGRQNALEIQRREEIFHFPHLPVSFDDYTILFLTDLHLDGLEGLTARLKTMVEDSPVDLCIIGGDFRMETHGPFHGALEELKLLIPHIRSRDGILGILGNHDCLEIVHPLEKIGVRFLINESMEIDRNGEKMWIVGVDDPHYYKCHDLTMAFDRVPQEGFSILVAHSNEIYREASEYNPHLYLCGHTHAGQIQIPPFGPIFTHSNAPRKYCAGTWQYNGMTGYTSSGVGVSGIPVRFRTRGEAVTITLKTGSPSSIGPA